MSEEIDLIFTEEHELLRQTARRFVTDGCAMSELRRFVASGASRHEPLAQGMAEQGWLGMLVPEAYDGAAMDHRSLAVVLEETGRALLPAPLLWPVLATKLLLATGSERHKAEYVPRMVAGELLVTLAFAEPGGSWDADAITTMARPRDGDHALSGVKAHVLWGQDAELFIVPARLEDWGIGLFLVPRDADGVSVTPEVGIDPTRPMARVTLDNVHVADDMRLPGANLDEWRSLHVSGYALLATEMIGAAQRVLIATRDYANDRVQFDRPIGSFQAVKHPLVDVLVAIENARSLCAGAVALLDDEPGDRDRCETMARMAKAAANQAMSRAVDRGVQLHGGFGFTWDCDMHLYYKRSLWSGATLGDTLHHRRHLADRLLDSPRKRDARRSPR